MRNILTLILITMGIAGCGGGGGGGGGATAGATANAKVSMPYTETGTPIGGLQMTIRMPPGVTPQLDPATGQVARSVVRVSGASDSSAVLVTADYTPASQSASGTLRLMVVDPNGFTPSEYITVELDVASGYSPKASDFSLEDYIVSDIDGTVIYGLTPTFTVVIN